MASVEKLVKSFEALKVLQASVEKPEEPLASSKFIKKETSLSKKDKINHCCNITDIICSPQLRNIEDFQKFLGIAIETLLGCCDDNDFDVRSNANECLNKTINCLLDCHLNRIHVELYKEIKKNGSSRCVRAALSRFAELAHLIRPAKCRPYLENLIPCLVKIIQRTSEESLQETLSIAIKKLMPVIGPYAFDSEITYLLECFLLNITSSQSSVRRTVAISLISICYHSKKPTYFYSWLITSLAKIFHKSQKKDSQNQELYSNTLSGIFLCLRHLFPLLHDISYDKNQIFGISLKQMLIHAEQIENLKENLLYSYEIILTTLHTSNDASVILNALEALQQLLKNPPKLLLPSLLDEKGITESRMENITASSLPSSPSCSHHKPNINSYSTSVDNFPTLECDDDQIISCLSNNENILNCNQISLIQSSDSSLIASSFLNNVSRTQFEVNVSKSEENTKLINKKAFPSELTMESIDESLLTVDGLTLHSALSCGILDISCKLDDIGHFTLPNVVSLEYCLRLLCAKFLLTGVKGGLISDKSVRVSMKCLALICVGHVMSYYPKGFFLDLHVNTRSSESSQKIWELVLYSNHSDPQIKGQTALVVANFIETVFETSTSYDRFLKKNLSFDVFTNSPSLQKLITHHILNLLVETNSPTNCIRSGLLAFQKCLIPIITSNDLVNQLSLKLISTLIKLRKHNYWLIKTELLSLFSRLPYIVLNYLERKYHSYQNSMLSNSYQEIILNDIFLTLLSDRDHRVRHSAAQYLVKLIPNLYSCLSQNKCDPVITLAADNVENNIKFFSSSCHSSKYRSSHLFSTLDYGFVDPFNDVSENHAYKTSLEGNLKLVVQKLINHLMQNSDKKYAQFGCIQAFYELSKTYSVTSYSNSWGFDNDNIDQVTSLLKYFLHLMSNHSSIINDINTHQFILTFVGNLISGLSYKTFKQNVDNEGGDDEKELDWECLSKHSLVLESLLNQLTHHIIKLLGLFALIFNTSNALPTSSFNNLHITKPQMIQTLSAATLSPIRKKNVKTESDKLESSKRVFFDKDKNKSNYQRQMSFINDPVLSKLHDTLLSIYLSSKISIDLEHNRLTPLLESVLNVLSQLLEIGSIKYFGKYIEEILDYLKIVFFHTPWTSVRCARQLLKCIFGINYSFLITTSREYDRDHNCDETNSSMMSSQFDFSSCSFPLSSSSSPGIYQSVIAKPYTNFSNYCLSKFALLNSPSSIIEDQEIWHCYFRKCIDKRVSLILEKKSLVNIQSSQLPASSKISPASYIRLFEPVVIKSLKFYTMTSDIKIQCEVLLLISHLIKLRVNYRQLDSDLVFLSFVLKQLEYIGNGQVLNSQKLIDHIFYFLILLSYDRELTSQFKDQDKSIIAIPEIIKMCDDLMASGQLPEDYALPALRPIVEDLFLHRAPTKVESAKELETQREVVIATLLKLANYKKSLKLLNLIVQQSRKEGEEKWRKISRQITDALLPLLIKQNVLIEDCNSLDLLHQVFESVSPTVFRPVDYLLKALFSTPKGNLYEDKVIFQRWMSFILVILRVLIIHAKEEIVLARLEDIRPSATFLYSSSNQYEENNYSNENCSVSTLANFLFNIVRICVKILARDSQSPLLAIKKQNKYLVQKLSYYLLYLTYMFQSGSYRRVAKRLAELIKDDPNNFLQVINDCFIKIQFIHPTIMLQWCNILILLGFEDKGTYKFWYNLIKRGKNTCFNEVECVTNSDETCMKNTVKEVKEYMSVNEELITRGILTLLCDFACENFNDVKHLTWLIVNNIHNIIRWSYELPIQDFIHAVHRNQASSRLFLQAIEAQCNDFQNASFSNRLLSCIELSHESQSGFLVSLLVKQILTNSQTRALAYIRHSALQLSLNKVKFLSKLENVDEYLLQLNLEDTDKLIACLGDNRYRGLNESLKKYRSLISKCEIKSLAVKEKLSYSLVKCDKDWFIFSLLNYCKHQHQFTSFALLLNKLSYEELDIIFSDERCGLNLLGKCITATESMLVEYTENSTNQSLSSVINRNVLMKACIHSFLHHLSKIQSYLPSSHCPFVCINNALLDKSELEHRDQLIALFNQKVFTDCLLSFASAYTSFLRHAENSMCFSFTKENLKTIVRIGVLYSELAQHEIESNQVNHIELSLKVMYEICNCDIIINFLFQNENVSFLYSLISSSHSIVKFTTNDSNEIQFSKSFQERFGNKLEPNDRRHALNACQLSVELMMFLQSLNQDSLTLKVPIRLLKYLKRIVVCLCRFPLVNSIVMVPPSLWQHDTWIPELSGDFGTICSVIPSDFLLDKEVLKQFIFRVESLGWINRVQFEEVWMSLLGAISIIQETEVSEEKQESLLIALMSINAITTLLLQSLRLSQPGNPLKPFFKMDLLRAVPFMHTNLGEKLSHLLSFFETQFEDSLENVSLRTYFSKPFSVDYLKKQVGIITSIDISPSTSSDSSSTSSIAQSSSAAMTESGHTYFNSPEHMMFVKETLDIDLNSCIHFLLDLYGQLIGSNLRQSPLLIEICASLSYLSNLFFDKTQFEWMFDIFLEIFRISLVNEDDITLQYLSLGICKSLAVLGIDQDQLIEKCKKCVEASLKNSFLPTRINTFYAFKYLLEHRNILPGGKEACFIPLATEYILKHLSNENLPSSHNEAHVISMWNLSFHLIETFEDNFSESEFGQKILQLALGALNKPCINIKIYNSICKGLERLLLCEVFSIKDGDVIVRTAIKKLKCANNQTESLSAVRIIIISIYVFGLSIGNETNGASTDSNEDLLLAMEKIGVLFDRLKVCGANEAYKLASIIPNMLYDFFPTQDILNKIIGEFLSSQHFYPQNSALIIFKVFNNLHSQSQESLIHEWVVLSLSSFIQIQPLASAIWSLSSFLISASSNIWIKNLFYCLQNRIGKYDETDENLFLFACCNFYNELHLKEQKESYLSIFAGIAKPGSIYAKVVSYLQNHMHETA